MVESFCNGIAFSTHLSRSDELTVKELEKITEWDATRNRLKPLTIRDKLIVYPRLAVAAPHELLQETNCPELKFFLEEAKKFRDAIVHASPAVNFNTPALINNKGRIFAEMSQDDCAKVVDSAITVIEKISIAMGRNTPFWLQHRTKDGPFDDSVFL